MPALGHSDLHPLPNTSLNPIIMPSSNILSSLPSAEKFLNSIWYWKPSTVFPQISQPYLLFPPSPAWHSQTHVTTPRFSEHSRSFCHPTCAPAAAISAWSLSVSLAQLTRHSLDSSSHPAYTVLISKYLRWVSMGITQHSILIYNIYLLNHLLTFSFQPCFATLYRGIDSLRWMRSDSWYMKKI